MAEMRDHPSVSILVRVANRLGGLCKEVVFVGGSVVPLLVPAGIASQVRHTEDVDCIVLARTWVEYHKVQGRLKALGFKECTDEGAPICRFTVDDVLVDVMPTGEDVLGFHNRWYEQAMEEATEVWLDAGTVVRVTSIAVFLATKFEAFEGRGKGDYACSADLEDIVTLVASRNDVVRLIEAAPREVQKYLGERAAFLLGLRNISDIISGYLLPDAVSQSATGFVIERFKRVSTLAQPEA